MEVPVVVIPKVTWLDKDGVSWNITFYWANVDGYARLIGMDIHGFDGDKLGPPPGGRADTLTSSIIKRELPFRTLASKAFDEAFMSLLPDYAGPDVSAITPEALFGGTTPVGGRPKLLIEGNDGLRQVAEVYKLGRTKAVARTFNLSASGAVKRVKRARSEGLL